MFGERLPLRYYLSFGMVSSGLFTALFGLGFYWNIHSLGYYAFVQVNTQQHKLLHLLPVSANKGGSLLMCCPVPFYFILVALSMSAISFIHRGERLCVLKAET